MLCVLLLNPGRLDNPITPAFPTLCFPQMVARQDLLGEGVALGIKSEYANKHMMIQSIAIFHKYGHSRLRPSKNKGKRQGQWHFKAKWSSYWYDMITWSCIWIKLQVNQSVLHFIISSYLLQYCKLGKLDILSFEIDGMEISQKHHLITLTLAVI